MTVSPQKCRVLFAGILAAGLVAPGAARVVLSGEPAIIVRPALYRQAAAPVLVHATGLQNASSEAAGPTPAVEATPEGPLPEGTPPAPLPESTTEAAPPETITPTPTPAPAPQGVVNADCNTCGPQGFPVYRPAGHGYGYGHETAYGYATAYGYGGGHSGCSMCGCSTCGHWGCGHRGFLGQRWGAQSHQAMMKYPPYDYPPYVFAPAGPGYPAAGGYQFPPAGDPGYGYAPYGWSGGGVGMPQGGPTANCPCR